MIASAKQNQTEPARTIGKCRVAKPDNAGGKTEASQPGAYMTNVDGTPINWCNKDYVRPKVGEWTMSEQWQEDVQSTVRRRPHP